MQFLNHFSGLYPPSSNDFTQNIVGNIKDELDNEVSQKSVPSLADKRAL
jgi:hypothetical protein